MDIIHWEALGARLRHTQVTLTHRIGQLLVVRTRDGAALSPRIVILTLVATVVVVVLGAALPVTRSGASEIVRGPFVGETPTSTTERQLSMQVSTAVWGTGVRQSRTVYDAKMNAVTVTITLGGTIPHTSAETATAQELAKGFCLMAQQAIWSGGGRFDEVTVIVNGPLQNEYGEVGTDAYAVAVVRGANGRAIDWPKQTPDSAWQVYDSAFLRNSFVAYV